MIVHVPILVNRGASFSILPFWIFFITPLFIFSIHLFLFYGGFFMKAKIIGYQNVDFTDKQTNNRIVGTSVFCEELITRNGAGYKVKKFFVGSDHAPIWDTPFLGPADLEIDWNGQLISARREK